MLAKAPVNAEQVDVWDTGVCKWFDPVRRYGFIISDGGEQEIFLNWTCLQESNIPEKAMRIGTPVRYRCTPPEGPGRRPRATHVSLMTKAR